MMKAIAVNGSPRKGWNTDLLLQEALKGAADAGTQTALSWSCEFLLFFLIWESKAFL